MRLPDSQAELDGPNMTPVIDMVFLLLIFFLCATRFDQEERELSAVLPEVVQAQPLSMPPQELVVNISREGRYVVARQDLSEDQLAALLSEAGRKNPSAQSVLIRGDAESAWKAGVRVMGLCNRAGIVNYRVAVVQQK